MWSNFFAREEDGRPPGVRSARGGAAMSDSKEGTIKLTFFIALVGVTLMVLAVGTDFWAELNGDSDPRNATCRAAYFGIWRHCAKTIEVLNLEPGRPSCGPVELPGVTNCSYFRFFTTGESARIMEREAEKGLFMLLAILALLSLCLMIVGSLSIIMALNQNLDFLIKLTAFCYLLSGLLVSVTLGVFQRACEAVLRSNELVRVEFAYMWSFACAAAAAAIVAFTGLCFVLIAYPGTLRKICRCCPKKGGSA